MKCEQARRNRLDHRLDRCVCSEHRLLITYADRIGGVGKTTWRLSGALLVKEQPPDSPDCQHRNKKH